MSGHGWKHDALADDLAAHLRGYAKPSMIWTNMQLGPVGSPRPDVYTLEPTFTRIKAVAYEVKISRADFLSDVQAGKALGYLVYAGALVFATPKGLVRKDELPNGAGLIERGDTGWRWAKKPTVNALSELPFEAWMKLLIDGRDREIGWLASTKMRTRQANEWEQDRRARKMLGEELGQMLADRSSARYRLQVEIARNNAEADAHREMREESDRRRRERIESDLKDLRRELDEAAQLVGLSPGAQPFRIINALRGMRPEGDRRQLKEAANALRLAADNLTREAAEIDQRLGETPA
ncbi:MAG TPA: hypothetical protein VGE09_11365 [Pseudoxanthomonas sp.]